MTLYVSYALGRVFRKASVFVAAALEWWVLTFPGCRHLPDATRLPAHITHSCRAAALYF